jgi:hypothetical protein
LAGITIETNKNIETPPQKWIEIAKHQPASIKQGKMLAKMVTFSTQS